MDLWELSLHEARELLHKGEISSRQLTEAFFQRIEAVEPRIHAFITLTKESALAEADQADDRRRRGGLSRRRHGTAASDRVRP